MRGFKSNKDIKKKNQLFSSAFTLVELIVVVVVIAILAAIAVVGYSSWRQTTATTQLKSDLNGVAAAMENARTFGDIYPTTTPSTFVPSSGVTLSGGGLNSGKGYCVDATNGTQSYNISSQYSTPTVGPCSVLYLDAGIAASYPGTGNAWTDLSGNGNNGTMYGGVGYSSANGGVMTFDGTSGYVSVINDPSLNITSAITISTWVKKSRNDSFERIVFKDSDSTSQAWGLQYANTNTVQIATNLDGSVAGNRYGTGIRTVTDTNWHYLVGTYNGSVGAIYVDGVLDKQGVLGSTGFDSGTLFTGDLITSSNPLYIGRIKFNSLYYYAQGQINDVRIFNKVLSSDEIKQNFNALHGRYGV